ncbi:unnamed protein product [Mesocestoides corti]|uniref:Phosphorylated adapter RNA export protein n=1 Tax=Mesocestoides corti TaxID=53468 RepID=A0A3P6HNG9_MESCO|nr:unnamed protein product [Mesocestoides corti]
MGSRKRLLKERLPPRSFDRSVSREHYGVDFDSPPANVVTAITNFLDEQREDLVELIVKTLGVKRALEFCYLTEDIENAGGLPTADGSRRRTPGGVYFLTIRRSDTVSREERKVIFRETSTEKALKKRLRQAQRRRGRRGAEAKLSDPPAANCDNSCDFENLPSPNVYLDEPDVD